eukprot:XP_016662278.1 PREDICTED: RING finger protein B-like [Acyrthosiphon pisum]
MTDYESSLRTTLVEQFPTAKPIGCWFHHNQAVWKKMKTLGYLNLVHNNENARNILKQLLVLPLLPEQKIVQGFRIIKRHARRCLIDMNSLFDYYERFWIHRVGVEIISVYGQARRTNNHIESFHNKLRYSFGVAHPNIWVFLNKLCDLIKNYNIVINQLQNGLTPTRNTRSRYIANSHRIQYATRQLNLGLINTKEFLNQCSNTVASYEENQRHFTLNIQQADNQANDTRDNETLHQQDETVNLQLYVIDESDHVTEHTGENSEDSLLPRRQLFVIDDSEDSLPIAYEPLVSEENETQHAEQVVFEENEHPDSNESLDSFIVRPRRQLFVIDDSDDSLPTASEPLVSEENETQHAEQVVFEENEHPDSNESLDSFIVRPRRQLFVIDDSDDSLPTASEPLVSEENETQHAEQVVFEENEHPDSNESLDSFIVRPRRQLFVIDDSDDSLPTASEPLVSEENETHHTEQANWNEADFIIPEEMDPDIIFMMEIENRRHLSELENLPFVPVSSLIPLNENENENVEMCVVCAIREKTIALVPCGHKSVCDDCVVLLNPKRCPLCNTYFTNYLRIWS